MPLSSDQFSRTAAYNKVTQAAAAFDAQSRDPAAIRRRVEALEQLLERSFVLPVLNRPIGLDSIIGLIPGIGDFITTIMGSYLVWEARNLGMSKWQITRMIGNIGIDTAIGAVPLVGDVTDFFFRSNSRNLRIIKKHLDKHHPGTQVIDGLPRT
jgi:Domain of unknown function (DUF4112)